MKAVVILALLYSGTQAALNPVYRGSQPIITTVSNGGQLDSFGALTCTNSQWDVEVDYNESSSQFYLPTFNYPSGTCRGITYDSSSSYSRLYTSAGALQCNSDRSVDLSASTTWGSPTCGYTVVEKGTAPIAPTFADNSYAANQCNSDLGLQVVCPNTVQTTFEYANAESFNKCTPFTNCMGCKKIEFNGCTPIAPGVYMKEAPKCRNGVPFFSTQASLGASTVKLTFIDPACTIEGPLSGAFTGIKTGCLGGDAATTRITCKEATVPTTTDDTKRTTGFGYQICDAKCGTCGKVETFSSSTCTQIGDGLFVNGGFCQDVITAATATAQETQKTSFVLSNGASDNQVWKNALCGAAPSSYDDPVALAQDIHLHPGCNANGFFLRGCSSAAAPKVLGSAAAIVALLAALL